MFKRFKFYIIILIVLFFNNFYLIIDVNANSSESMRDVRPHWDALPLYEIPHPPGPKCIGEHNDLYYVDNLN